MSQTLTLASFAAPLHTSAPHHDDEDFFTSSNDDPDTETVSFADQLMDIDFPMMLDINTRSTLLTLPTPTVHPTANRKRPIWTSAMFTEEFLLKKSAKKSSSTGRGLPVLDIKEEPYVDVTSDSACSVSSESDVSSLSLDSIDSDLTSHRSYTRFLRTSPNRTRPYPSLRDSRGSRDSTSSEWRSQKETKKEGTFVNPREEMSMLRLSCTCQSRNTGKSLHLWEFLLEMLADRRMKSVIAWTGHAREFRVVNSREVAREWGNRKNKPHMNFDKMSRAMRYYYKKNILTHGNKQRLVYSFCQEAICPHYEKIIKLALKTRPPTQGSSCPTSPPQEAAKVIESVSWNRASTPITYKNKNSSASLKLKNESEKILTEKLCPGRSVKWSVKRPARQDHTVTSCCEGVSCKLYQPRDEPVRTNKTLYRSPANRNSTSSSSNQPKIKINTSRPNYNDCFKFS